MRVGSIGLGLAVFAGAFPAAASVFGSLANFDVVNDTGRPAYGFEIEIDDPSFDHTRITSVFGLNRNFGLPGGPGAVTRFGLPRITDLPGVGVKITYGGAFGGAFTPSGSYATPGESCWPLGGGWSTAAPCDHYGVSTLGTPAKTKYSWLLDDGTGNPVAQVVGIPSVQFAYTPPAPPPPPAPGEQPPPPAPAFVRAVIDAVAPNPEQPENVDLWGEAFWVKTFTTKVAHNIDLGNLFRDDPDQEAAEVETEWSIFQNAPADRDGEGANEAKEKELEVGDADKAVIRRYEFYKYLGDLNPEDGEVICDDACETDPVGLGLVGDFVGAQMAGFNVNEVLAPIVLPGDAPIPEPGSLALLLAGLGGLGLFARRRAR